MDLIGAAEAAQILGVTQKTVNRMAADGRLPVALRMPGKTGANLFHRSDVEALVAAA